MRTSSVRASATEASPPAFSPAWSARSRSPTPPLLVRSAIGHSATMGLTLAAIGLKHHQSTVVQQDSPSLRGQLKKVRHLVSVTPVKAEG